MVRVACHPRASLTDLIATLVRSLDVTLTYWSETSDLENVENTTNDAMTGRYCFKVDTAGGVLPCKGLYV